MDISPKIDHTILKADTLKDEVKRCCEEALQFGFAAVCVPPYFVPDAAKWLEEKPVKVATVVGFPMGYSAVSAKVEEIKRAITDGADELDAVVNIAAVKNANWKYLRNEIESLTTACHMKGKILKLILETALLTEDEIRTLCELCVEAQVDFVKTSTGFNGAGASVEVVRLLRSLLPENIQIKASGGIRDRTFALQLIEAGASRIGTSAGVAIVQQH